jgi:hypothetical protein
MIGRLLLSDKRRAGFFLPCDLNSMPARFSGFVEKSGKYSYASKL